MMVDLPARGYRGRVYLGSFLRYRPLWLKYEGDEKLIDFPVKCTLTKNDLAFEKLRIDRQDLLFITYDGEAVPFWIEKADENEIIVWLKFSEIRKGEEIFWLYYGNNNFIGSSSGSMIFEFFDDFENLENWDSHASSGEVNVSNSLLILDGDSYASGGINGIRSKSTFNKPLIIEFKLKITAPSSNYAWKEFGVGDTDLSAKYLHAGNNIVLRNQESGYTYFLCKKDGSSTTVGLDSITSWHIESIYWASAAKNLWDYELKAEISTNVPTTPLYIMLGVGNNAGDNAIECDWVRIRKYAETMPEIRT